MRTFFALTVAAVASLEVRPVLPGLQGHSVEVEADLAEARALQPAALCFAVAQVQFPG